MRTLLRCLLVVLAAAGVGVTLLPAPHAARANGIAGVSAGGFHGCALTTAGGLKCWGRNGEGELGNGTTTDSSTPVDVIGLTGGVAAVSAGLNHTCALTTGGGVKCWGLNGFGQLGNGTTTDSSTPVDVNGLTSGVAAIAAAGYGYYTCAVTTAGSVKCWGRNLEGQLGDGQTCGNILCTTPVDVSALTGGVAGLSAGSEHACAVTTSGGVKCWGWNGYGQLGDAQACGSVCMAPVDATVLSGSVAAITAGGGHTCALTTAGGLKCWGGNGNGELGDGQACGNSWCLAAVDVTGLTSGVAEVSASGTNTCAVTTAGGVKCWGYNGDGQLGNGTFANSYTPVDVTGLASGANVVSVGVYYACAVPTGGGVKCWGWNVYGQLGNGTNTGPQSCFGLACSSTPVDVLLDFAKAGAWSPAASMASARATHAATLLPNGKVLVTGGFDGTAFVGSAELWDPGSHTWSAAASMATARAGHTATLLPNGEVLVVGGSDGSPANISSAELYDPTTDSWSAAGNIAVGRQSHTATLLTTGKVLISGGVGLSELDSAELYDPMTNSWTTAASMSTARYNHTATLLQSGLVLVAGGLGSANVNLATAELYDPVSDTWAAAASMTATRESHTAALLSDGKVLVAGGCYISGGVNFRDSSDVYDPATNSWSAVGPMNDARCVHTETLLASGKVLVAGGLSASGHLAGAELYNPYSKTWSATASMANARRLHTATLLGDGRVLIAGGKASQAPGAGVLSSAELYLPLLDSDSDGCTDARELQTSMGSETSGGRRNPKYFWDFYDVWTRPNMMSPWMRDKVVTVTGDILAVARRFGAMRPGGAPTTVEAFTEALAPPTSDTGYHADYDRGPLVGPNLWNSGPPDGAITVVVDVLQVARQFGHRCR